MMTDVDMIQAMARAIAPDRWFIYDHEHICNPEWANTRVALSRLQATVALTVIQPELDRLRAEIKVLTEINVNLVAERDERLKAADETIDRLRAENIALIDFDGHGITTTHHKDRSALVHALLHHREYFRLIAEQFQAAKAGWDEEAATDARQDQINEMRRAQSINPIPNQLSFDFPNPI